MILNSILIAAVSCYVFVNFHDGSKPPPYLCDIKFNLQTGYEFWTVLYTDFGKIQYKVTHNLHRIFFSTDDLQKTFIYDRLLHTLSWSVYKEKTVFRTNVILL